MQYSQPTKIPTNTPTSTYVCIDSETRDTDRWPNASDFTVAFQRLEPLRQIARQVQVYDINIPHISWTIEAANNRLYFDEGTALGRGSTALLLNAAAAATAPVREGAVSVSIDGTVIDTLHIPLWINKIKEIGTRLIGAAGPDYWIDYKTTHPSGIAQAPFWETVLGTPLMVLGLRGIRLVRKDVSYTYNATTDVFSIRASHFGSAAPGGIDDATITTAQFDGEYLHAPRIPHNTQLAEMLTAAFASSPALTNVYKIVLKCTYNIKEQAFTLSAERKANSTVANSSVISIHFLGNDLANALRLSHDVETPLPVTGQSITSSSSSSSSKLSVFIRPGVYSTPDALARELQYALSQYSLAQPISYPAQEYETHSMDFKISVVFAGQSLVTERVTVRIPNVAYTPALFADFLQTMVRKALSNTIHANIMRITNEFTVVFDPSTLKFTMSSPRESFTVHFDLDPDTAFYMGFHAVAISGATSYTSSMPALHLAYNRSEFIHRVTLASNVNAPANNANCTVAGTLVFTPTRPEPVVASVFLRKQAQNIDTNLPPQANRMYEVYIVMTPRQFAPFFFEYGAAYSPGTVVSLSFVETNAALSVTGTKYMYREKFYAVVESVGLKFTEQSNPVNNEHFAQWVRVRCDSLVHYILSRTSGVNLLLGISTFYIEKCVVAVEDTETLNLYVTNSAPSIPAGLLGLSPMTYAVSGAGASLAAAFPCDLQPYKYVLIQLVDNAPGVETIFLHQYNQAEISGIVARINLSTANTNKRLTECDQRMPIVSCHSSGNFANGFHVRLLTRWHTLYPLHGQNWSFTLRIL